MDKDKPVLSELLGSFVSRLDNILTSPPPPTDPYTETEHRITTTPESQFIVSHASDRVEKTIEEAKLQDEDEIYKSMIPNVEYLYKKKKIDVYSSTFIILISNLPIPFPPFILGRVLSLFGKIESLDYIENIKLNPFHTNFVVAQIRSIYSIISIQTILQYLAFNFNNTSYKLKIQVEKFTNKLITIERLHLQNNEEKILREINKTTAYFTEIFSKNTKEIVGKIEDRVEYSQHCLEVLYFIDADKLTSENNAARLLLSTIQEIIDQINTELKENFVFANITIGNSKFFCNSIISSETKAKRMIEKSISSIPIKAELSLRENMRQLFQPRLDLIFLRKHRILENEIYRWLLKLFNKIFNRDTEDIISEIIRDVDSGIHPDQLIHNLRFLFKQDADIFVFCLWRRIHFEVVYLKECFK